MAKQTSSDKQGTQTTRSKEGTGNRQSSQNANSRKVTTGQAQYQAAGRKAPTRTAQRAAKQQQRQQQLKDDKRAGLITLICILAAVVVGGGLIGGIIAYNNLNSASSTAVTSDNPAYPVIDGIACQAGEQLAYHIHAHVSIYINGKLSQIPQYVGIASDGSCYYWLHTHDTSGVIHIESPTQKNYTLGNFLDEWSQQFSSLGYPSELGLTSGWQVWVNGKPYSGDFHNITLTAHELITLAYDSPGVKPDTTYAWNGL
ncbi:MAG TPA: hypothetical protein VKV40_24735 [Ktedonobacteraceae bacterium]|nr:hypothetical protein [Ktedonobacteraceae bacterium]